MWTRTTNKFTVLLRGDSGAVAVIVAVLITALLGSAALAVDMGALYSERRQLQTAADAAALAGVRELPTNPASAISVAQSYITANTVAADDVDVTVRQTNVSNDTIQVVVTASESPLYFARIFGMDTSPVTATAAAIAGSPTAYNSGVMPFTILAKSSLQPPWGYLEGQLFDLVVSAGDQQKGNYNWLNLSAYADYSNVPKIIEAGGTSRRLSIGDIVSTDPGSAANPRYSALAAHVSKFCAPHQLNDAVMGLRRQTSSNLYEPRHLDGTVCNRMIICPVIAFVDGNPFDWTQARGASANLRVIGFATVFVRNNPSDAGGVIGQFIQAVPSNSVSPGPYSSYAGLLTWLIE